jgi:uncharacterized membrane protein
MSVRDPILAMHIATGTTGLLLGPLIMLSPKRRGRHTQLGTVYHWNMLAVCVSAAGLAFLKFSELWWFLAVATFSYANAFVGWRAARKRNPGWLPVHIGGMGGSYIALVTALLVVNLGDVTPIVWFVPTVIGSPLIALAINRQQRSPQTQLAAR